MIQSSMCSRSRKTRDYRKPFRPSAAVGEGFARTLGHVLRSLTSLASTEWVKSAGDAVENTPSAPSWACTRLEVANLALVPETPGRSH